MKRIENLDVKQPLPDEASEGENAKELQEKMKSVRHFLKQIAFNVPPKSVDESDELHQISMKLRLDQSAVDFEEAEFKLLKKNVETNVMGWPAHMHHFVLDALRTAEKRPAEQKPA